MSDSYIPASTGGTADGGSGKVDTAKQEARDVRDTAAGEAKNVAGTAKEEAKNVAGEAKSQVKNLYSQARQQLSDQAGSQQTKVASGLRSAGDQLDKMASNADSGIASDVVRNVSQRLGSAASWLDDRDPQALLGEVKNYARRSPAVFIGGALVAGLLVGRLTRALAANAREESTGDTNTGARDFAPTYTTDTTVDAGYGGPAGSYTTAGVAAGGYGVTGAGVETGAFGGGNTGLSDGYGDATLADDVTDGELGGPRVGEAGVAGTSDYDIPGGAANVGLDDTPVFTEVTESETLEGRDDRRDSF